MGIAHCPERHSAIPHPIPHPEESALVVLAAYSERYGLTITARGRIWTVTGDDLEEPKRIGRYTDLVSWLGFTFGRVG